MQSLRQGSVVFPMGGPNLIECDADGKFREPAYSPTAWNSYIASTMGDNGSP